MVGFQFFYVVLLHQFTYRNRKVFSTKECCFYCIDVCQACIDCFGLVIPYANSSKCLQILCNNMFLKSCDNINCCQIFKKTSLHFLFHNTSNMVFTWKIHQDYLPHNALTREQNIWYFLLQRNGFNACKINRILCFFLRQLHVHYVTSKHWCRGTGDCCMVCTIHTHEAKVVASTTIEPA